MSMSRGLAIASRTAVRVMALKVTRWTFTPASAFFFFSTSRTCQEIASPSRSGSVARISVSAPLAAAAMSLSRLADLASTSQLMSKSSSGRTEPSLAGGAGRQAAHLGDGVLAARAGFVGVVAHQAHHRLAAFLAVAQGLHVGGAGFAHGGAGGLHLWRGWRAARGGLGEGGAGDGQSGDGGEDLQLHVRG